MQKKSYVIITCSILLVAAVSLAGWQVIGDSNKSQENPELDNPTAQTTDNLKTKDQLENVDNNDERIADPSPEGVEDYTVAINNVEFRPAEDYDNPEDVPTLPVTTNHYRIEQLSDDYFEIELYAILNKPEQYEEYRAQLKQFKQEALQYLTENQYDTQSSRISYIPSEAAQL